MSLRLLAESHVELIALDPDKWGDDVTRLREGVNGTTTVTAVIAWETAEEQRDKGRGSKQRGSLHMASDATFSLSDRWLIGGRYYATISVGEPEYGMQVVSIAGVTKDLRTGSRGVM